MWIEGYGFRVVSEEEKRWDKDEDNDENNYKNKEIDFIKFQKEKINRKENGMKNTGEKNDGGEDNKENGSGGYRRNCDSTCSGCEDLGKEDSKDSCKKCSNVDIDAYKACTGVLRDPKTILFFDFRNKKMVNNTSENSQGFLFKSFLYFLHGFLNDSGLGIDKLVIDRRVLDTVVIDKVVVDRKLPHSIKEVKMSKGKMNIIKNNSREIREIIENRRKKGDKR